MKVISLGLGVQSTALYYMSSLGQLPMADLAVFVDPGGEKRKTMAYLHEHLLPWADEHRGVPIMVVQKKNLYKDLMAGKNSTGQTFVTIPAYTKSEDGVIGMRKRQCTNEYKIEQIHRAIREVYELKYRARTPKTEVWKGISLDEIERLSIPQQTWETNVYPFVNYQVTKEAATRIDWGIRMTRLDITNWYRKMELPIPPKSSCTCCLYQSDAQWADLKKNEPKDFEAAVLVDRAIRNNSPKGEAAQIFLHRSCVPLEEVEFSDKPDDLWHGECSGECHT